MTNSPQAMAPRAVLADVFTAALQAVQGERLIAARSRLDGEVWDYSHGDTHLRWDLPRGGRVLVVGAGKATASLAAGLEAVLGDRIDGGVIVVKHGHGMPLRCIQSLEGGHPIPDAAGQAGAQAMLESVEGLSPDDRVFVLLTGGASALLAAPAEGLTLADEAAVTGLLLRSGATIEEMNTVRKRLSRLKGGGLARAIAPAQSVTLLVSDVPSNDPAMIGSGPTLPDGAAPGEALAVLRRYGIADQIPAAALERLRQTPPAVAAAPTKVLMLADSGTAVDAAAARAKALSFAVEVVDAHMDGDTHAAAAGFVAALRAAAARRRAGGPPTVLLSAGETTLKVTGEGRGGRNQEFALVAAKLLAAEAGAALLAAGTDGTDGPTEAAGAFADGSTAQRAVAAGLDLDAALADNDSNSFFARLSDLHVTGPTGTNVMDLVIGVVS